jgi:hypothetical protein
MTAYRHDPDFDPGRPAFYYVRVLEIPAPRWTTYDAAFYGIKRPDNSRLRFRIVPTHRRYGIPHEPIGCAVLGWMTHTITPHSGLITIRR